MIGQIVLGGITVLFDLWPPLVMGHFVLSAILVWNAVVLNDRAGHDDTPADAHRPRPGPQPGPAAWWRWPPACVLLTGTVVTGTGPHGGDERVARLPFVVEDVARIHSLTAWAFLAVTIAFGGCSSRQGGAERGASVACGG